MHPRRPAFNWVARKPFSGGSAQIGDFQPGDHGRIDASQVSNVYHASTMTKITDGTMDENAAASEAMNDMSRPLSSNSISNQQLVKASERKCA
jgi:hypothetical protein